MKKRIRAVIIENRKVLLIHRIKEKEEYWVFPGGGEEEIDNGDDSNTIIRECLEELGVKVSVGQLFETLTVGDSEEKFYLCSIVGGELGTGNGPEFQGDLKNKGQYLLEWITHEDLITKRVLPDIVKQKLLKGDM